MGKYKKINIASTGGGGGGGGSGTPPYDHSFTIGSWSLVSGEYKINIPESTHNKGINPIVQAYELVSSKYVSVMQYIEINSSGDVTLIINELPDSRYAGKITIGD
jgi:hypothetical protein